VIRFNDQGPDGLINIPSPGAPPKLDATHRAFLARTRRSMAWCAVPDLDLHRRRPPFLLLAADLKR